MSLLALHRKRIPAQRAPVSPRVVGVSALNYPHRLVIRGESFHHDTLVSLRRQQRRWVAQLVREPHNRQDHRAIAVHIEGQVVGHVAREQAVELAGVLDDWIRRGIVVAFAATLSGGTRNKPNIGVFIAD